MLRTKSQLYGITNNKTGRETAAEQKKASASSFWKVSGDDVEVTWSGQLLQVLEAAIRNVL